MAAVEEGKVAVTPDVKSDSVSTDHQPSNDLVNSETQLASNVDNSESQPNKDLSSSKADPGKELPVSETQATGDDLNREELTNHELDNAKEPVSNEPAKSEALPDNQSGNTGAPDNNQPVDTETAPSNPSINSEAPTDDQLVSPEATLDNKPALEAPSSHQMVDSEAPSSNGVTHSEIQTSNDVVAEAQQTDEVVLFETQQTDEVVLSETQRTDEVVLSETQQTDEEVLSEKQQNNEVVMSETQQSSEVVISDTQQSSEVVLSDTQPSSEVVMSDVQPSGDLVASDTQPSNETIIHEAQTTEDVVMSEALPENELANSTIDPNNQLPHPENLPDHHQFTNLDMIPEDQLPQPESLPHSEPLPSSDPLGDSHLRDIKPPHDHMAQYDALPNNHLDHSQELVNHQLTNAETMSHDQLDNSQMLPHYELATSEPLHSNQLVSSQAHYEIVNANNVPSYEIVNAETPLNHEEHTPETQPSKRRKKKSIVWEHFTIETVSAGCRRACCKQCKQSFAYSTGSKVAGTSHLKRHIAKGTCPALLRNQDPNQLTPYTPRSRGSASANASTTPKRRYRSPNTPYIIFDQDRCRHEIARMIIMHDYPLHMVEHPGFVAFVQNLQPQFNMVTFNTVQGDCVATYLMEKQNLMKYFEGLPGRVCLTLDVWTSRQSVGYVYITGHFVDCDWKLQKRTLNVVMEPYPDSDSALSHAVAVCLSDWSLEGRLFSITCNQVLTEAGRENLRPLLSVKNPLILNGQLLVGDCIARTLSNVATDLLSSAQGIVNKIRDSVKYVKTSESHEEKFLELKQQLQVPSERSLFIDDQSQWNTTYQMLVAASELKEVFSCLDTSDPDYKRAPSMQDWKLVETLCTYLKPLFDAANILTTTTHPTAITFFHEVWKLQLDLSRAVMTEDPFISNLTKSMQEKIDKYWRDCSLILALAVVMDPRFKMKLVEFSFTKIYGDDSHEYVKIVDDGIHELFHEYVTLPLPLTPAYADDGNSGKHDGSPGGALMSDNGLTDFDVYIMETTSHQMKSELDQYLEESLLPRVPDFDVLGWWRLNRLKYPTLSKMARDILSVPVSTVPADSLFDTNAKEMDQYRSSLRPETVEALVCAKDWMHFGAGEASNALVKMEF